VNPWLTVIVVNDVVKEAYLLDAFFAALRLQKDALDGVQILVCNQAKTAEQIESNKGDISVDVYQCQHDFVGEHPVWDLMADLGRMRQMIRAPRVVIVHKEVVFSFLYFLHVREYVQHCDPVLMMGNLMRVATKANDRPNAHRSETKLVSSNAAWTQKIIDAIAQGRDALELILYQAPTCVWEWWSEENTLGRRLKGEWCEDLFIVKTDWLEGLGWFSCCEGLYFQDVYDCMKSVWQIMQTKFPRIHYLPYGLLRVYHLAHVKDYGHLRPEFWEYFKAERFAGTIWQSEEYSRIAHNADRYAWGEAINLRKMPGGTLRKFEEFTRKLLAIPAGDQGAGLGAP
jgi:hypothetical protein